MCGLCGYYSKNKVTAKHVTVLKGLLIANQQRGADSTGVAWCGAKITTHKKAESALDFIKEMPTHTEIPITIGHTRLATHGVINAKNAHPFTKGNITGAHNGIVSNYLTINNKVEVDSEVIFELIDQEGFESAFAQLEGMFAIVWYDKRKPGEINLVRSGNPLHLAKVPGYGYIWSSENLPLQAILSQNFTKYEMIPIKENIVYTLTPKSIVITSVKFKPMKYNTMKWSEKDWEKELAEYDGTAYEPRSIFDSDHPENETLFDIANNEGCAVCGRILTKVVWTDADGYVYCYQCQKDGEGIFEKREIY